jgi:hypothetical protein
MTGKKDREGKPDPMKGKVFEQYHLSWSKRYTIKLAKAEDIRSAVEWLKELHGLITDAIVEGHITVYEGLYWEETLKYEEAFEDVMEDE